VRTLALLRESCVSALAARVPTVLILLVTAAMTFAAATTSGRSAALQDQLDRRVQDAGARVITVSDLGDDAFLTETNIETVAALSSVETAAAVTRAATVTNRSLGWGGPTVSAWGLVGSDFSDIADLQMGRWPEPGEAIVSTKAAQVLRMESPSGAVITRDQQAYAVVGGFEAEGPFDWLNEGVLYAPTGQAVGAEARVVVSDLGMLGPTERTVRKVLAPNDPANLRLTSPRDLAEVSHELGGDLRSAGYETTLIVLLVGALFVGAVSLADVLIRRRDLGRRRALGATRFDLVALICLRVLFSAILGAVLGVVAVQAFGAIAVTIAPLAYAAASATLVAISALLATIPAGLLAANRDPVTVLRTA
jgi:putative ABC transport system permease protein